MSAALSLPADRPWGVRLRPAPRREPPFDDELPASVSTVAMSTQLMLPFPQASARTDDRPPAQDPGIAEVAMWTRRLLVGIIESSGGRRSLNQLADLLTPAIAAALRADYARQAGRGKRHWASGAVIRSIHPCRLRDGVVEISATLHSGPRLRAVALRAEMQHGRWRCTRLQFG
jgi:hypothetical protein